jgi:hypothetical protein
LGRRIEVRFSLKLLAVTLALLLGGCAERKTECSLHAESQDFVSAFAAFRIDFERPSDICESRPFSGIDASELRITALEKCGDLCREEFIDFSVGIFALAFLEEHVCDSEDAEFVSNSLFPEFLDSLARHSKHASALESCLADGAHSARPIAESLPAE